MLSIYLNVFRKADFSSSAKRWEIIALEVEFYRWKVLMNDKAVNVTDSQITK